jgi:8-oxo-dGTP pyrophosphatase MutT (NUDIX family)
VSLHAAAVGLLSMWRAPTPEQDRLRREYLGHLARHPDGVWRDGPPAHLTASCFVLDPLAEQVLLALHRKGGFWVQLGGHCEPGDADLAAAARREAREESGLADVDLLPGPVDLDRHVLPAAFGRCREHLDVAFVATAPSGAVPAVSDESHDVAWWPVDALPEGVVPDLPPRLARVAGLVRGAGQRAGQVVSASDSSPGSSILRSRAAEKPSRYPRARSVRG